MTYNVFGGTLNPAQSNYRPDALPAAQPTASKHWRWSLRRWDFIRDTGCALLWLIAIIAIEVQCNVNGCSLLIVCWLTEMYLTRAWKVDSISIWNLRFIVFPKIQLSLRSMLGFMRNLQQCNSWHMQNGHSATWCSGTMSWQRLWLPTTFRCSLPNVTYFTVKSLSKNAKSLWPKQGMKQ